MAVSFLLNDDQIGGNSGSPTLNGKADLVGLLFDDVYESIIDDWITTLSLIAQSTLIRATCCG